MPKLPAGPLRIRSVRIKDFKRIEMLELQLDPDGKLVIVTGENGAGKSSAMDAIIAAIVGPRGYPAMPIREGQKESEIVLDLGEMILERRITRNKEQPELKLKSRAGLIYPGGQKLVDDWRSAISFDPMRFMDLKPEKQVAMLLSIVELGFDPAELDAEKARLDLAFTDAGRDVTRLQGALKSVNTDGMLPADAVETSVAALTTEYNQRAAENQQRDVARSDASRQLSVLEDELETREQRLRELKAAIEAETSSIAGCRERFADYQQTAQAAQAMPAHDLSEITAQISGAEQHNAMVRRAREYYAKIDELNTAEAERQKLKDAREAWEARRADLLAAAQMPVPGLSFSTESGKERLFLNSIPLEQCCSSEQTTLSVALAMRLNPTLRVIFIRDGDKLGAAAIQAIKQQAGDQGYELWLEQVHTTCGEGNGVTIVVIEDGKLALDETPDLQEVGAGG
jgi:hypothetical protein